MLGAGTVINPIVKIVTTVAVLGAAYLFIVKPILDTTNDAIDSGAKQARQAQRNARHQAQQAVHDTNVSVARSQAHSYIESLLGSWPAAARRARKCVDHAGDDGREITRCANFAHRLLTVVATDRSFALSYADSLRAEGRTDDARRVEECVKHAGYAPAPMQRCRDLSDRLLFG